MSVEIGEERGDFAVVDIHPSVDGARRRAVERD
jgi:hypothetical protein